MALIYSSIFSHLQMISSDFLICLWWHSLTLLSKISGILTSQRTSSLFPDVSWFICWKDNSKSYIWILMKWPEERSIKFWLLFYHHLFLITFFRIKCNSKMILSGSCWGHRPSTGDNMKQHVDSIMITTQTSCCLICRSTDMWEGIGCLFF